MRVLDAVFVCSLCATTALAQPANEVQREGPGLAIGHHARMGLSGKGHKPRGVGGHPALGGQPETSDRPAAPQTSVPSIASSLGPLGDLWGARTALEKAGITFSLTYIGETLGNTSGGLRRGSIYEGRLDT